MATNRKKKSTQIAKVSKNRKSVASLAVARQGIQTSRDFAQFMSKLMLDVVNGAVSPSIANAACNAGGKLLRIVEFQLRQRKDVQLVSSERQ